MSFDFSGLNPEQKKAVLQTDGPVLILAGAGSGKTRTLTSRIAYLVKEKKIQPSKILALTFTNKAAREMKERVEKMIGENILGLWIGTFHSVSARIMRSEAEHMGYSKNFSIYDVDDQVRAIKKVISTLTVPQQLYTPKMIQNRLSKVKNQFLFPEDLYDMKREGLDEYLPSIYLSYQRFLKENNALDFDDLLLKPIELFQKNPDILKKYSDKFQYVLVDEYQDTNKAQYLFIREIVKKHQNLCVVGDEDQAIYGWRGADINNILNFKNDFKNAAIFKLEENYRSNKYILEAANSVVKHNTERIGKNLWTRNTSGSRIDVQVTKTDLAEAERIREKIHDEVFTNKRSFQDIAVLYRTNAQSRIIEDQMRKHAISYNIVGGVKFYERKEIKDILAYLKLIVNQSDSISLKRIVNFPLRGVGDTTVGKIEKYAEMEQINLFEAMGRVNEIASISPAMSGRVVDFYNLIKNFISLSSDLSAVELTSTLASETGILHHYQTEYDQYESESRVANIRELFRSIEEFTEDRQRNKRDDSLSAFLEEVSLMTDVDTWNSDSNAITLMTLHAAKGLEFPVVFISGLEMGLLPLQRNSANLNELEEERRLLYVGMTRAEEKLYLSYAQSRRKYNQNQQTMPSLFIDEIPQELMNISSSSYVMPASKTTRKRRHRSKVNSYIDSNNEDQSVDDIFKIGQNVYHATFGRGQIRNLEGHGDKMKITVEFTDEGITKKLMKEYANLTPLEE
ncbi:MAG: UvrD-helicase domain-containing protein [Calditrichae bacterium]|nr:UvrD-helicase domain-containing protein [Calditrichota bacterium]MCB9057198.1 UvrD-helicase domain-containing protein [Calditrichia bacterium]